MKKMTIEDKLYLSQYKSHAISHVILDKEICDKKCKQKICLVVCPSKSYDKDGEGNIVFHHENCLECGSCRIICPEGNVKWNYPVFGKGIVYKFG